MSDAPTQAPAHYRILSISMYLADIDRMDAMVAALKARGATKATRSALIRIALDQLDLEKVPRGI